ncbi:tol-pal system protein YbgF [Cognatiyoonia koreensis]|uniref:Cell division coordinator CpoB n=1 Tax=Cognatiyoonia koreensis TaxID=364200 RepID=A0A1I0MME4_9RHOB|nr:tol-pal system protein YbgF [Cognatiyoonia koreensis]SEV89357.1 tol-pal system protein YbgF [Cognatiyoonia koreensis]
MLTRFSLVLAMGLAAPFAVSAQDQTLADIRQQLSVLYVDIQRLRTELSTTGALTTGAVGNTPLDRLNAIESELQRLTSKTEELEFRVNRITVDGTNRIGDLEFRLCELEEGCDITQLGDTPSLGGNDSAISVPAPAPSNETGGPALAVGEQADLTRAQEALAESDFRSAADILATFSETYPGSSVTAKAAFLRGQALEGLGETADAARAYLESFSANADSEEAPQALYRLGAALGDLGQTQDACLTLGEVSVRYPGNPAVADAQATMQSLGCS